MPVAIPLLAGATLASGILGYSASKDASSKQYDAAMQGLGQQREAMEYQKQIRGENKAALDPYMNLGQGASSTISSLYGFQGSGNENRTADYSSFYNSPDYQFAQQQGLRALDMSAASKGLLQSGGQGRALQQFGQGLAGQQFGNYFQRMMGLAQLGNSAAGMFANSGNQAAGNVINGANNMAQSYGNAGQAQASGIVGGANAITGAMGSGINNLMLYSALNKSPSAYAGGSPMNITPPQVGTYSMGQGNIGGTGGGLGGLY